MEVKMNTVITIGRQFGSGGHVIGEKVAEHFGIPLMDKDLVNKVAIESGFAKEIISSHDERPTNSFLYNLVMDVYSFGHNAAQFVDMPISHKVFLAQFDTIKKWADEGPCVLVGRCADYALNERDNVLNVFIYANEDDKIKHISAQHGVSSAKAREMCSKTDKQRQSYYNYYTSKKWGHADSYHFCLNSSVLGIDGTANLIVKCVEELEENRRRDGLAENH
jgi:cytidylate kinase